MLGLAGKLFLKALGGTRNERIVRKHMRFVTERVNPLEAELAALSDDQLRARSRQLKQRRREGHSGEALKPEAFAMVREACRRALGIRLYDVQLMAAMILDEGWIAEEATGEGKTFACYPSIYMAVLDGMHVHVVTVNDYLVQRDAGFAKPVFALLDVSVGYITGDMPSWGPQVERRQEAYRCDVTYGTNSEFGFDYLRDNTKNSVQEQVQGPLDFAIIDEVDNILIDEARTPLIISGPAWGNTERFRKADAVARELIARNRTWDRGNRRMESLKRQVKALEGELDKADDRGKVDSQLRQTRQELADAEQELSGCLKHYDVELDRKSVHMTHEGVAAAQDIAGIGSFYVGANMEWPHLMENALRAHVVYERDKDYVVQDGSVLIVDEFTGRILEGRQWSDGLHQAVEAKERVRIKDETQTIATVTIQNYFRMYRKLAGMTGTAMTEAGEFMKIYKLDVATVPTHRPVNRLDHDDRIYAEVDAKYRAIVEEINEYSKSRRPVLVGTTSVEKSERLSEMLTRGYGIEHQVLNARPENAAREAEIVARAGTLRPLKSGSKEMVGTVTIATNMAGRGTDIKLGAGVVWDNCKVPPAEKLAELGVRPEALFPPGSNKCCIHCPQYDGPSNCAHCFKPRVDAAFPGRGRTDCRQRVPCGLHIVGTERHEARRIDNQLRGRSGRQGDPGSSRFFLSLRDELMAIFAGEWTLKVLGWLGLQGDEPIEHSRLSKGIERAQKKVEERNFETRKSLLDYDEVMDHQRRAFYGQRQQILHGRQIEGLVSDMLRQVIDAAVGNYLDPRYPQRCMAEWARQNLQIQIRDDQVRAESAEDLPSLEQDLRDRAKEEAAGTISITLGEYMDEEGDPREWDLRGLSSWAMSRFNVNLSQAQLRRMRPQEVDSALTQAAAQKIDEVNLSPLARYLEPGYALASLADWATNKFAIAVTPRDLGGDAGQADSEQARTALQNMVQTAYARRQIEYPVEYAMEMTIGPAGTDNVYACNALTEWANRKYGAGLAGEDLQGRKADDIRSQLVKLSEQWSQSGVLEQAIRQAVGEKPDAEPAIQFARTRFDTELTSDDLDGDAFARLVEAGRRFLRREMTELERFVLLQIYDTSWKDHLLAMDHLKSGIGLRGFAERDPKVAYKTEGSELFREMLDGVKDKVTEMIFKVRLSAGAQMANVYQISNLVHEQLSGYDHLAQTMAEQAQAAEPRKVQTIVRDVPRVGRNDPCPCGSGKKYKKCCGKEST